MSDGGEADASAVQSGGHGAGEAYPPEVTPELVEEHGLNEREWELLLEALGREPTFAELGVFSAMWSEHCGYQHTRPLLADLPTEGPQVIQGPGENAGVVDAGEGWGVAFKIESHNHPSAVEPYQGAATGVGGILRDVFTMGARPVAVFDSLRFGSLDSPRSRYLLDGVVRGVGDYGNCVGVPTLGGETVFDPIYERNPLVNVMCVGFLPKERLIRGEAEGVGNAVMAVGARTGRDGIHGATFASEELDEESDSRPQVQVGDPFTEKLLLEASLELIERDLLVGIQDMGAAGLTSSATEMAARSGTGVEIDIDRVPTREPGMTPYEILLSESQERMLVVARPGREEEVREVLDRWELEAATIGRVTDDGRFRVLNAGETVVDIPVEPLVDGCPTYVRDGVESGEVRERRERDLSPYLDPGSDREAEDALLEILDSPSVASRRWIYDQYDTSVQTRTVAGPGGDAAVIRLADTRRAVAATVDGNGRYVYLHPRRGAQIAVAEAARNLACVGARPLGITNCLNFGNPEGEAVYHQLEQAVAGLGEACRALDTPVTGGNASLYNETPAGPIYPTPSVGMVGVMDDLADAVPQGFRGSGDDVWLAGTTRDEIGASEYLSACHGVVAGPPPSLDLEEASRLVDFLLAAAGANLVISAHDCSDGGLAVALAESALSARDGPHGVRCVVSGGEELSPAAALFGESQSRVVLSADPDDGPGLRRIADEHGVPLARIGQVGEPGGRLRLSAAGRDLDIAMREIRDVYESALPRRMEDQAGLTT
ncbi:MAG: phosphoribosylformylglycinamidine synthase subunit PurL [Candidatus Palauibacterales bacterium]|nr:phosphoribosylformylglycinamidine synthase subunit PurL [Candidatus Palauibacterales bacterium]